MTVTRRRFSALTLAAGVGAGGAEAQTRPPVIIARGGASGDAPAATRGAYDLAIRDGADFIFADLVASKDGALVAGRESELSATTDVASRPEFAGRRTTKTAEGFQRSGWFCEDFTLAEIKTLVRGEPGARRGRGDAPPQILTFEEVIDIARAGSVRTARVVGVYVGLVRPGYFASLNLALEPRVATAIRAGGYNFPAAAMIVESGDPAALKTLAGLTRARRVLRIGADEPADLAAVRAYAQGLAPDAARADAALIERAHAAGLFVHAWVSADDSQRAMEAALLSGADGLCADLARPAARARGASMKRRGSV